MPDRRHHTQSGSSRSNSLYVRYYRRDNDRERDACNGNEEGHDTGTQCVDYTKARFNEKSRQWERYDIERKEWQRHDPKIKQWTQRYATDLGEWCNIPAEEICLGRYPGCVGFGSLDLLSNHLFNAFRPVVWFVRVIVADLIGLKENPHLVKVRFRTYGACFDERSCDASPSPLGPDRMPIFIISLPVSCPPEKLDEIYNTLRFNLAREYSDRWRRQAGYHFRVSRAKRTDKDHHLTYWGMPAIVYRWGPHHRAGGTYFQPLLTETGPPYVQMFTRMVDYSDESGDDAD